MYTGDVGITVVGSLVGIMNKTGIIAAKVYLLASRQINSLTLLWAYRLEELRTETSPPRPPSSKTGSR